MFICSLELLLFVYSIKFQLILRVDKVLNLDYARWQFWAKFSFIPQMKFVILS